MEKHGSYSVRVDNSLTSSAISSKCDQCSACSHSLESIDSSCHCHCSTEHSESVCHHHQHHHHSSSETHSWVEELKSSSSCDTMHHHNRLTTLVDFPTNPPVFTQQDEQKKRRLPGSRSSRLIVFFLFTVCVLGAVAAFFCWPRTPRVSVGGGADSQSGPPDWNGYDSNKNSPSQRQPLLKATWQINVTMDNRDNWIPTHLNRIEFVIVDSLTLAKFAWATMGPLVLAPGTITPVSLTFNVNYLASSTMDPTFQNLYSACGPEIPKGLSQRPALNVLVRVSFHIFGIIWTPMVTATPYTGGLLCPLK